VNSDHTDTLIKYFLVLVLIYISYIVAKPFLGIIITGLVFAVMCFPIYNWLNKKIKNPTISSGILTLGLILVIVIPAALLGTVLISEASSLIENTQVENVQYLLEERLGIHMSENTEQFLRNATKEAANFVYQEASTFVLTIPQYFMGFLILLFVFFYTFRDGPKVLHTVKKSLPLHKKQKERIEKKFATTIESLVYGEIAISLIQGLVATIGFYLLGVPSPVFWGLIVGLVALLPGIGPALIWTPIAFFTYLHGDVLRAVLIALFGFFILTITMDAILRAKILGIKGHIHPVIILVGVLGGLAAFGLIGLIIGPLILVILDLVIEMYLEEKRDEFKGQEH